MLLFFRYSVLSGTKIEVDFFLIIIVFFDIQQHPTLKLNFRGNSRIFRYSCLDNVLLHEVGIYGVLRHQVLMDRVGLYKMAQIFCSYIKYLHTGAYIQNAHKQRSHMKCSHRKWSHNTHSMLTHRVIAHAFPHIALSPKKKRCSHKVVRTNQKQVRGWPTYFSRPTKSTSTRGVIDKNMVVGLVFAWIDDL